MRDMRELIYMPDLRRSRRERIERFYAAVESDNGTSEPGPVTNCPTCNVALGACPECGETPIPGATPVDVTARPRRTRDHGRWVDYMPTDTESAYASGVLTLGSDDPAGWTAVLFHGQPIGRVRGLTWFCDECNMAPPGPVAETLEHGAQLTYAHWFANHPLPEPPF